MIGTESPVAPDYTIADNPHCLVHCGPLGPEHKDDKRDFTLVTSGGSHLVYGKNGIKVEHITGYNAEACGYDLDGDQKSVVAKAILAANGDIVLTAEAGDIRMKARNIYIETEGEEDEGNFLVDANGQITLATGDEIRLAGGNMCLVGKKAINLTTDFHVRIVGKLTKMKPPGLIPAIPFIGSWQSVIQNITNTCK